MSDEQSRTDEETPDVEGHKKMKGQNEDDAASGEFGRKSSGHTDDDDTPDVEGHKKGF